MGFRLILIGLIFFFNPCVNIVDFLPDFIGCIFLCIGLRKLADVEDRFYDARKYARIMLVVYALKAPLSLYVPARWNDGLLPVTFMFSVGEILLFILFFTSLFGGIEYSANLHGGEKHLRDVGDLSRFCVLFSVVKCALAFLPESFALFPEPEPDFSYRAARIYTVADAKPYAVLLCFVAVLALGIWYLVRVVRYFNALYRDSAFCGNLYGIYRERVLENPHMVARRRYRVFFLLMIIGVLFLLDVTIDAVDFTPDPIAYLLMYAAIYTLTADKKGLGTLVPLCAVSVLRVIYQFLCEAGINEIMGYESYVSFRFSPLENGNAVWILAALCLAESVLFFLLVRRIILCAAEDYENTCGKPFLTGGTLFFALFQTAVSVLAAVLPLCKAYCYHLYINDTLVHREALRYTESFELAQGLSSMSVLIITALFALYLYTLSRKADMELAPPEYR